MDRHQIARISMAIAASVMLAACASKQTSQQDDPQQRSSAEYNSDTAINTRVQSAVLTVPGIHADNVKITTYQGVVTLQGTVDNQAVAQEAIDIARQVQGVKKVDYDLKIK